MMASYWDGRASLFQSKMWPNITPEDRIARQNNPGIDFVRRSPFWSGYQIDAGVADVWAGPVGYFSSLYSVYGPTHLLDATEIRTALELASEGAREYRAVGTLVTNLPSQTADRWRAIHVPDACIRLDIAYACDATSGVNGMLTRLPRHERTEWRRLWRRAQEHGVEITELTDVELASRLPVALKLANESAVKHGIEPLYDINTFVAVGKIPGARLICADQAGHTLAAFLAVEHHRVLYLWAGGVNYEKHRPYSPYLFLLYEILTIAPERAWDRIEFGRGNYAFKRRYGFEATELWSMYYAADPHSAAEHAPRLAMMHDRLTEFMRVA